MARRKNKNFALPVTIVFPLALSLICAGFFLLILKSFFCRYPYFNLSKVSIEGAEGEGLLEFKRGLLGKNIFAYNFNSLKKQIEQAGGDAASVSIERRLPGELRFIFRKRLRLAQIKLLRFHPIDESGTLLPGASHIAYEGLPVIFGLEYKAQKGDFQRYYSVSEARDAIRLIQQKNNSNLLVNYAITKINLRKQKMNSFFIMEKPGEPRSSLEKNNFSRPEVEVKFDPRKPAETISLLGELLHERKNRSEVSLPAPGSLWNIEYIDLSNTKVPILREKKETKRGGKEGDLKKEF